MHSLKQKWHPLASESASSVVLGSGVVTQIARPFALIIEWFSNAACSGLAPLSDRLRTAPYDLSEVKWYGDSVHAFGRNLKVVLRKVPAS